MLPQESFFATTHRKFLCATLAYKGLQLVIYTLFEVSARLSLSYELAKTTSYSYVSITNFILHPWIQNT